MVSSTAIWPGEREDQRTFIETLTHDDRDSSYIVAWVEGGTWKQRPFKAGSINFSGIPLDASVYMTRNGFVGSKREAASCRQVNAMMFDIDCHTAGYARDVPRVLEAIDNAVESGALPAPNLVVNTGRGIQIYFVLESSIAFKKSGGELNDMGLAYFKDVEEALASTVRGVIEPLAGVEFDSSVLDYARVGRVPGTVNPRAGCRCKLVSAHSSFYSLKDLKGYGAKVRFSNVKRAQFVRAKRKTGFLGARLSGVERLQRHRGYDCVGSRENMCFVYYNTATQLYGPAKAHELTCEFNSRFHAPLPLSDIDQIAQTVDGVTIMYGEHKGESGFYPLRASSVVEKLFMTNREMEAIQFFGTKRQKDRAAQKARNEASRRNRDDRIVYKFQMGATQQEVADSVGCSKRTVANVLSARGVTRADRFTLRDKFDQVIAQKRVSAISRHTSWLCVPPSASFSTAGVDRLPLGGFAEAQAVDNSGRGSPPPR